MKKIVCASLAIMLGATDFDLKALPNISDVAFDPYEPFPANEEYKYKLKEADLQLLEQTSQCNNLLSFMAKTILQESNESGEISEELQVLLNIVKSYAKKPQAESEGIENSQVAEQLPGEAAEASPAASEVAFDNKEEEQGASKLPVTSNSRLVKDNPELCELWDEEKNGPIPSNLTTGSCREFYWRCLKGHKSYRATVNNITHDRGCPECAYARRKKGVIVESVDKNGEKFLESFKDKIDEAIANGTIYRDEEGRLHFGSLVSVVQVLGIRDSTVSYVCNRAKKMGEKSEITKGRLKGLRMYFEESVKEPPRKKSRVNSEAVNKSHRKKPRCVESSSSDDSEYSSGSSSSESDSDYSSNSSSSSSDGESYSSSSGSDSDYSSNSSSSSSDSES